MQARSEHLFATLPRETAMIRTTNLRGVRERRRRMTSTRPGYRRRTALLLLPAALASCLSDDLGTDGQRVTARDAQDPIPVAPPPGEIVDTMPASGWTEGVFSVSDNGAAEYDVPLWVPDGSGGLKPSLSLHYNSQAGNGLLGVGWSVTGISYVRPCARTINQDGRNENVGFVGADALCLDGQRLREIAPPSGSGTERAQDGER